MSESISPDLEAADRAAEELARSQREPFSQDIDPSRSSALDDAFAEATKDTPPVDPTVEHGRENGGVKTVIDGAPKDPPVAPVPSPEEKAAADQKAIDDAAAAEVAAAPVPSKGLLGDLLATPATVPPVAPTEDPYDVKLRSDASPKTRETFDQLKAVAKQREAAAIADAQAAKQSLSELQTKVAELEKRTLPPETETELKELRQFRAQFDTANDPEFRQKFETRIGANYAAIYSKLQAHGFPAAELDRLKSFSQADRDASIDALLAKLPSLDRKFIEAKLLDNINVADDRDRALQEARTKADELLAAKKTAPAQAVAQRDTAVATLLKPAIEKLSWLHVQNVPATAGPDDKKRIEADNAFALSMQHALRNAIVDDSPNSRAEAALAVPLAHHFQRLHASEKARADGLQKKLVAITSASATSRTARSISTAAPTAPKVTENQSGTDALDELFIAAQAR